jgi:hypothetical protein
MLLEGIDHEPPSKNTRHHRRPFRPDGRRGAGCTTRRHDFTRRPDFPPPRSLHRPEFPQRSDDSQQPGCPADAAAGAHPADDGAYIAVVDDEADGAVGDLGALFEQHRRHGELDHARASPDGAARLPKRHGAVHLRGGRRRAQLWV